MTSISKRLRCLVPGRIFNRRRNNRSGSASGDSHKVVSFMKMLVTRAKDVPEAAAAWVASEEEILSEQGPNSTGESSFDKIFPWHIVKKVLYPR